MRIAPLVAGAVLALGMAMTAGSAQAAPPVASGIYHSQAQSLVDEVRHRRWHRPRWHHRRWGYCARWRNICANRYGWGGWRYRRCVRRHGC